MDKIEYQIIEHQLLKLYLEIQKQLPTLHRLTFDANTFREGETTLSGFIHVGVGCESYWSIDDLISLISKKKAMVSKREILFRKFN